MYRNKQMIKKVSKKVLMIRSVSYIIKLSDTYCIKNRE
ncbi:hypothetical protein CHCC14525_1429 [Bacillus licheniformis]|nr:hypothetical protein CHCC14525_1429 [Bacillus licheniformis]